MQFVDLYQLESCFNFITNSGKQWIMKLPLSKWRKKVFRISNISSSGIASVHISCPKSSCPKFLGKNNELWSPLWKKSTKGLENLRYPIFRDHLLRSPLFTSFSIIEFWFTPDGVFTTFSSKWSNLGEVLDIRYHIFFAICSYS